MEQDTLFYRLSLDENSSLALGARYRYFFGSISSNSNMNCTIDTVEVQSSGKRNNHRLALLTNYRFLLHRSFFIGAIAGIDIWKSLSITANASGNRK